jgi:DNA mismatch repair ATPase MutS
VCDRAEQILATLERHELKIIDGPSLGSSDAGRHHRIQQLGLFRPAAEEVADQLRRTETDRLTPLEALNLVAMLRKRVSDED